MIRSIQNINFIEILNSTIQNINFIEIFQFFRDLFEVMNMILLLIPFTQGVHPRSKSSFFNPSFIKLNYLQRQSSPPKVVLSGPSCNIATRSVEFKSFSEGYHLKCNDGSSVNLVNDDSFTITGSSNSNNVYIKMWDEQRLTVTFDKLTITNNYPVQVSSNSVKPGTLTIILKGTNKLTSTGDKDNSDNYGPTLWCRDSIIIIKESSSGTNSLTVIAFKGNAAIGTISFCKKITIGSGIVIAKGSGDSDQQYYDNNGNVKKENLRDKENQEMRYASGAGIGTGIYGTIEFIEIKGGVVEASGGYHAAGID